MAENNTKLLEQLTQRFQKYKKDVNATLIALYKDTKKLLQQQQSLQSGEAPVLNQQPTKVSRAAAESDAQSQASKRHQTTDGENAPKKRGRKPGQKNGTGQNSQLKIKVRNPEEDGEGRVGKKRGRKPGSVNKATYDAMSSQEKLKYDAKLAALQNE